MSCSTIGHQELQCIPYTFNQDQSSAEGDRGASQRVPGSNQTAEAEALRGIRLYRTGEGAPLDSPSAAKVTVLTTFVHEYARLGSLVQFGQAFNHFLWCISECCLRARPGNKGQTPVCCLYVMLQLPIPVLGWQFPRVFS